MLELFISTTLICNPTISLHSQFNVFFLFTAGRGAAPQEVLTVCGPSNRKLNEEKSKHIGLAQQNGFGPNNSSTR
jgi:hypothetical protein